MGSNDVSMGSSSTSSDEGGVEVEVEVTPPQMGLDVDIAANAEISAEVEVESKLKARFLETSREESPRDSLLEVVVVVRRISTTRRGMISSQRL